VPPSQPGQSLGVSVSAELPLTVEGIRPNSVALAAGIGDEWTLKSLSGSPISSAANLKSALPSGGVVLFEADSTTISSAVIDINRHVGGVGHSQRCIDRTPTRSQDSASAKKEQPLPLPPAQQLESDSADEAEVKRKGGRAPKNAGSPPSTCSQMTVRNKTRCQRPVTSKSGTGLCTLHENQLKKQLGSASKKQGKKRPIQDCESSYDDDKVMAKRSKLAADTKR